MVWILFISFVGLMMVRVPISMAIGASVLLAIFFADTPINLLILPLQVVEGLDNSALLAVPFFIMAGNLMNAVGMTDKIFDFATALIGHFRAGLAQVNVLASLMFAGVSGAAVADCAGLGTVEVKAMRERGYPSDFAAALTVASSVVGPIIPPSIPLVIYGFITGTSIGRLFLAGIVPGLLIAASLMIYNRLIAGPRNFPREPKAPVREIGKRAISGIAALVAPAIILVAILTGFTTATEAGVLACAYSLLLGLFYRTLNWKNLRTAITDTMVMTTVVMLIVGFSQAMGWLLAFEQVPQAMAGAVLFVTESKYLFLLLLIAFLLVIGLFVEGVPAMLILVPMLLPVVQQYGIDPVHFGLIFTYAVLIGIATPPMGIGLYVMVEVSGVPFERIAIAVLPMLLPLIVILFLVTYVPGLSLWLPNLIMGPS